MTVDSRWLELVCKPYCQYFKPDMQESFGCQGVKYIMDNWRPEEFKLLLNQLDERCDWEESDEQLLEDRLCSVCPYLEDDCAYRDPDAPDDSKPCGGYLILAKLWVSGVKEVIASLKK